MARKALFDGLVVDEFDRPVGVAYEGDEPCYVVDDRGFRRHIDAAGVDRQVLQSFKELIAGHEDLVSEQAAKMLGQDDPFSVANIANRIRNMDQHFEQVLEAGIPEDQRAYMGMMGFRVRINLHGEVLEVVQPGMADPDEE
jgi:hypothetical protein